MAVPSLAPLPSRVNRPDTLDDDVERLFENLDAYGAAVEAAKNTAVAASEAGANGYSFKFDSGTAAGDPGSGELRFSGTAAAATAIHINATSATGSPIGALIDTFDDSTSPNKGTLRIVKSSDPSKFAVFRLTAVSTPAAGWRTLTVEPVISSSSSPFVADDALSVQYSPNGDRGAKGDVGNADKVVAAMPAAVANTFTANYSAGACVKWSPPPGNYTLIITNWPAAGTLGEMFIIGTNLGACTIVTQTALDYLKPDGTYATTTSLNANQGATLRTNGVDQVLIWGADGAPKYAKVAR